MEKGVSEALNDLNDAVNEFLLEPNPKAYCRVCDKMAAYQNAKDKAGKRFLVDEFGSVTACVDCFASVGEPHRSWCIYDHLDEKVPDSV